MFNDSKNAIGSRSGLSIVYEDFISSFMYSLLILGFLLTGAVQADWEWMMIGVLLWLLKVDGLATFSAKRQQIVHETVFLQGALTYAMAKLTPEARAVFLSALVEEGYVRHETMDEAIERVAMVIEEITASQKENDK